MLNRFLLLALSLGWAAQALALLPIQHWQTADGARVLFVQTRDIPMVDVSIDFPAGSAFDTKEKSGLAALTQRTLKLGAGGMSEDEIARRIADIGARLSGRFDSDGAGMALRTLTSAEEFTLAMDVFAQVIRRPEFPAAVIEREKARIIAGIKEADTKPETILNKAFHTLVYGSHPYSLPGSGAPETVAALTREDVVDFYRRHYNVNQAVIAIVGDLDRAAAQALAEQLVSGLPRAQNPATLPRVDDFQQAITRNIAHPATQTHLLIGAPGIKRGDPDYFPLFVGNYILGGGGFVSRITEEVRSKRGLAYSAYSYFSPLKERGLFAIGLQTRKDQAYAALEVVRQTLKEFLSQGPTPGELKEAKQNIVLGFPLRIDSNRKILGYLSLIGFYNLPITYLEDFVPNVEKVTIEDIRRAFARHVNPQQIATVIVGSDAQ